MDTRASPKYMSSFPFETVAEIEGYSDGAIGGVYYLLVESLVNESPDLKKRILELDHIASHVAKCLGLVTVLRGVVFNASRGRCYIPNDLLLKHGVSHQDFLRFSDKKEVSDVCYDVCCSAKHHMDTARHLIHQFTENSVRSIFLTTVLAEMFLKRIEKSNFNVFSREMQAKDTNIALKLWIRSFRNKWLK